MEQMDIDGEREEEGNVEDYSSQNIWFVIVTI